MRASVLLFRNRKSCRFEKDSGFDKLRDYLSVSRSSYSFADERDDNM